MGIIGWWRAAWLRSCPEHADEVDQESLVGFAPTHAVDVIASCKRPVDHIVTALLTAAVMDLIGGIANAGLREDQMSIVAGLPGIVATLTDPWPAAYGSADFLSAWALPPGAHGSRRPWPM